MSILIKNMEMPNNCGQCILCLDDSRIANGYCMIFHRSVIMSKLDKNCPLVEIPPHGRLIDADALHKLFEDQWHYLQVLDWNENPTAEAMQSGINWCINTMHDDAPTIIPAKDGE